ncbi:tol-pal system-associated acyl-CoA thioesterase [Shewanella sp. WXL01]|uniref:Tol-pal system-associated acyl-CoA thioesterase n=1 Tax=Shewanella maritima TaxID=2520507 RepID=A0A411PLH6_9GAMM|nr:MULTISPECIES: tol-pal system-associated acyl-CoA thioesterase [Shewanella]NKF52450.1 tol-pal system-associated acyl-CoA thioesterase [Shewanella sp. WXL01]QBF84365.1 tol-pal system-associated acyl-CoA thioesterase [Shewanella maritima]
MTFNWPISIYYEDTDAGGVVYHSNYLNFFERARTEWLKSLAINQTELLKQDIAFVVKHADIDFRIAARFEQSLSVRSTLTQLKKASMVFHQQLIDEQDNVYCEASITVACIALSKMRPKGIPQSIVQEFNRAR